VKLLVVSWESRCCRGFALQKDDSNVVPRLTGNLDAMAQLVM